MSRASSCPDVAVLERLRAGAVTETERTSIERHLNLCDACNGKLEAMAYDEEGSPRPIACPDRSVLKRLAEGSLGMYSCEAVEHHVEVCAACQADFEALSYGLEPTPRTPSCPDRPTLKRLLDGRLEGPDHARFESHLEECGTCQKTLEDLACADEPLVRQVKAQARDHASEAPGLARVIGLLKDESGLESATGGFGPAVPAEILGLLERSDVPGELGTLGPYRINEVLGRGGMGIVLKAFDPTLHRAVAIKVLAPQLATNNSARQRFAREARAAAAVRNEHVVAIHAVDEWKRLPYLVMEFIPGSSLQDRIDRTAPLDITSILRIGMQTAAGLAAAHAQGLVHRDIKPSNILLENGVERVKLTDFGLARAVDDASLTQSGVVAGTPLFMAPEQAQCETVDHRADLFSLGAVLYAMCTGRSPFRAPTTLGVLRRVSDDPHRPVREVNPEIPHWLAAIIDRLLAKDRAVRYQSAAEVSELLGRHLARRQRGQVDGQVSERASGTPAAIDVADVGPVKVKRPPRQLRWRRFLVGFIISIAVAFLLLELSRWTRFTPLGLYNGALLQKTSQLVVHVSDPRIELWVNNHQVFTLPEPYVYVEKMQPQKCLVVAKGRLIRARRTVVLEPGWRLELTVGEDGSIEILGEWPIRPSSDSPLRGGFTDAEREAWVRDRTIEVFHSDPEVLRLTARIESLTALLRAGVPAPVSTRDDLDRLKTEYQRRWKETNDEIREGLSRKERSLAPPLAEGDRPMEESDLNERIAEEFRNDPEVDHLSTSIGALEEKYESIKTRTRSAQDPALVEIRSHLNQLKADYERLWRKKSEEIRARRLREESARMRRDG
jgi:serine/threonine protein kinase